MPRYHDDDDDDDYRPRSPRRYPRGSRRSDFRDDPIGTRPRRRAGKNNYIVFIVAGIAVLVLVAVGGIAYVLFFNDGQPRNQPVQNVKPFEPQRPDPRINPGIGKGPAEFAGAFTNKLSRPVWRKHRVGDYELELPGTPRVDMVTGKKKFRVELLKYDLVAFTDSDLELMFYFVPLPDTESRLLDRFYKEFDFNVPVKDRVKDNAPLAQYMEVIRDEQVRMDGKIGWHLTFKRKPNEFRGQDMVQCRMLRMTKGVHILIAAGNHLPDAQDVVDRFFSSLKVDGKQPEDPDPTKPVPLAKRWRKYTDVIGSFAIDMPGLPVKSRKTNKTTFESESRAVVHVDGTDLEFVVVATRRSKRSKLSEDEFFKQARKSFLDSVPDAEVVKEEHLKVDGRDALQVTVKTDVDAIIWRAVRVPERRFEYEMEVTGSKLPDYQADIDRFFASFKFQK